jgi:hypothetical protein
MKIFVRNIWNSLSGFAAAMLVCLSALASVVPYAAVVVVVPVTTGCAVTEAQIVADAQVVASAAHSIGNLLLATDAKLGNDIILAANDLSTAASQWTTGGTLANITSALNAVDIILASIPIPMVQLVAEFLPIAVAGIEAIFANLPQGAQTMTVHQLRTYNGKAPIEYVHHRIGRSLEGDFKAAWNAAVNRHPELHVAKL